ncbi:MAG: phosphopantothenate--cysteine ligase [Clostridia bacterium]|nr:phosphopantothenate--cysteine ligase [Clostridia bacterium]
MKKNIIITSGPTNERIDSVMKITNMSTGALGNVLAETLLQDKGDEIETIYYVSTKMSYKPRIASDKVVCVTVESTEDLIEALREIFAIKKIDIIIHSAAVGDYAGKYVIRAEELVDEIWDLVQSAERSEDITKERLMGIFENPRSICNNDTKISSYEPHLMTMLTLTPKVISMIKTMAPDVTLVGFKLLDGVSKDELYQVASKLREKNRADYIVANDLSKIGGGKHWAMILGEEGIIMECNTKKEIAEALEKILF